MAESAPSEIYGKEEHTVFLQMSLCFMTYCAAIKHFLAGQSAYQTLLPCISSNSLKVLFTKLLSLASAEMRKITPCPLRKSNLTLHGSGSSEAYIKRSQSLGYIRLLGLTLLCAGHV